MTALISYFRESFDELGKVKWPTRQTTVQYSTIVLGSVIIFTAFLAGIDSLLSAAITWLLR